VGAAIANCVLQDSMPSEFYENQTSLATANPVHVTAGSATTGIDANLSGPVESPGTLPEGPPPGSKPNPPERVDEATIGSVRVKGPSKIKKGRTVVFRIITTNSGGATATGVRIRVKGRGANLKRLVGKIAPHTKRSVKINLKARKSGKYKLTFKVTTANAGSETVKKKITVRK
jgi:hypothetical protein